MFKKLLSALTVMLFVFGMNAGAQKLQTARLNYATKAAPMATSTIALGENQYWAGYWNGEIDDHTSMIGFGKVPGDYAVATKFSKGSFITEDKTVEGVKFTFVKSAYVKDVYVWMSTELPTSYDKADICFQKVEKLTGLENKKDAFNEVKFDKPYKVDSAKDLYVGYSFTLYQGDPQNEYAAAYPIIFQPREGCTDMMFAQNPDKTWSDLSKEGFGVSAMQVLVNGSQDENAVIAGNSYKGLAPNNADFEIPVELFNVGSKGIESINATIEIADKKIEVEKTFKNKVEGFYTPCVVSLKMHTPDALGQAINYKVTIDKVNGVANTAKDNSSEGYLTIISRMVKHKPLFEEFTGMWCGWCPRGIVAMERIAADYGEDVVRVAVHSGDRVNCSDYERVIQAAVSGFPAAAIDRNRFGLDPYMGTNGTNYGIQDDIDDAINTVSEAEIEAKPVLEGDILKANAEVTFLFSGDASQYCIGYVLTEDGMTSDSWSQKNYYSDRQGAAGNDSYLLEWVKKPSMVEGVVFNEVAIAAKGIEYGVDGSIPATVKADEVVKHSVDFDLKKYSNIQNRDRLNLITILFNADKGEVVNADVTPLNPTAGIDGVVSEGEEAAEVARYTIDGQRIYIPAKGVNIVKYSDGTVKKVLVK